MTMRAMRSFADLAMLGEDTRVEVIHGELVQKANPAGEHSEAEAELVTWLRRRFDRSNGERWPGGWWIRPEIHVQYATHEVFCHDLAGWRRTRMPDRPAGWPIHVRPDWVCEVLSPKHEKRDRVDKMAVLHAAGVPHYWIFDHDERLVQIYRHAPAGYLLVASASPGETIRAEPFDAVELRTDVILGGEDDED